MGGSTVFGTKEHVEKDPARLRGPVASTGSCPWRDALSAANLVPATAAQIGTA